MALTPGTKILISDLNLMPRSFASTAARDAYYAANPSMLVAGVKAVIGTGADYAEYLWDGTAWRAWTTPWQAITSAAGFTGGGSVGVRLKSGVVVMRGHLSGTLPGVGATVIGTVPTGFRPADDAYTYRMLANASNAAQPVFGFATTAGEIRVYASAAGAAVIGIGGLSGYSTD